MAGNYINAPADRLAWDRDGSGLVRISKANAVTQLNATVRQVLNDEDTSGLSVTSAMDLKKIVVLFPIPVDLVAFFLSVSSSYSGWSVSLSKDSTTGVDGTWEHAAVYAGSTIATGVRPEYRSPGYVKNLPTTSAARAVRAVAFQVESTSSSAWTGTISSLHLYGYPSDTATTNRLALWHPTADIRLPPDWFDWGNAPRSSSADLSFRIKNLSSTLTAENINLYIEALTPGTPSVAGMLSISSDGGASFEGYKDVPELAPGEVSDPMILRRVVPANATLSLWSARLAVDVSTWRT